MGSSVRVQMHVLVIVHMSSSIKEWNLLLTRFRCELGCGLWNAAAAEIIAPSFMRPGDCANEYWASTGLCRANDIILIECLKNGMKFASFTGGKDENALSNLR